MLSFAPAPASAAVTIPGAVVAFSTSSDWPKPYRLSEHATYLATFGGGNSDALVTSDGGCAIKSGKVYCYGIFGVNLAQNPISVY